MRVFRRARFRDVLVGVVVHVTGAFVLEVLLVVVGQVVLPGGRFALGHS
jgi:hypothetical protein